LTITYRGWVIPALFLLSLAAGAQGDYRGENVVRVEFEGLEFVSPQLVRQEVEVQAGVSFNPRAVARDIRNLYDLDFFTTIKADVQPVTGGVAVTYIFEEKRIIDEIKIIGNDKIREREIRGRINWREGTAFVADQYAQEREAILQLYQEKGFPNAVVDIIVEEIGAGRVRITYQIDEGAKARIKDIEFQGNEVFTDRELRRFMETKRKFLWFLGGKYNEDQFNADLRTLVDRYGDEGRLEAEISGTDFAYSDNRKNVRITVFVEEGPEYTVGNLAIANNTVFDDDEILRLLEVQAGDVHDRSQVNEDSDLVQRGYRDSGYILAEVSPQVTLDRESKTTNITYLVQEGSLKYIRAIEITGNDVTKDEVIRRNITLVPGDRFDGSALQFSQRLLNNLRYFSPQDGVRFTREIVEEDERFANLLVDVEEAQTGDWTFGVSGGSEDGVAGFTSVEFSNFDILNWPTFRGGGQNFTARVSLGTETRDFRVSFTDPEFLGNPFSLGVDVFDTRQDFDNSDFTQETQGLGLRLGKQLSPFVSTQVGLIFEDIEFSDVPVFAQRGLRELWTDDGSTISLQAAIVRSTLDRRFDPTEGSRHTLAFEIAGFGGDHEFYKIEQDSQWFWGLDEDDLWVASERIRVGWVNEYGDTDFVPLSDRFFVGGTSTVRGFDTRTIGPELRRFGFFGEKFNVGGEFRIVNNAELKYKLTDQIRFYLFTDAGGVWEEISEFDLGGMRYSIGIGFGVEVPQLGPIRVDYGFPINPEDDEGSGRLHLQSGFRF